MKGVTLNKNSWHFKIYSKIVSDNPPKSLCPYFWTMVLLTILSPFILLFWGCYLISDFVSNGFNLLVSKIVPKKKEETYEETLARWEREKKQKIKREKFWGKASDIFVIFLKYVVLPAAAIFFLYFLYAKGSEVGWLNLFVALGVVLLIIGVVVLFIFLCEKYGGVIGKFILKMLRPLNVFNWKITKMTGMMIVATYKKMCPLITWVEENPQDGYIV